MDSYNIHICQKKLQFSKQIKEKESTLLIFKCSTNNSKISQTMPIVLSKERLINLRGFTFILTLNYFLQAAMLSLLFFRMSINQTGPVFIPVCTSCQLKPLISLSRLDTHKFCAGISEACKSNFLLKQSHKFCQMLAQHINVLLSKLLHHTINILIKLCPFFFFLYYSTDSNETIKCHGMTLFI